MNNLVFIFASLLGAIAIAWMGYDFAGANTLALAVTFSIGGVYLIGIVELLRFRRATTSLQGALGSITPQMTATENWYEDWLRRLDPALSGAVRSRIAGERSGLPTPVFTPYLVGLLVMLGLLGTFVGMVSTLGGAVSALQGSTELDAIRASLAAPIQGLGVAFGTSVAGVAASAMLGLISTLVRHERILATRQLDSRIASEFKAFSPNYQREQAYAALHAQAGALPAVASDLHTVAAQLASLGDKLGESLLANQNQFHAATEKRFNELATSVDRSLRESLTASASAAGDSLQPVLTRAVEAISQMLQETQQQQVLATRDQLGTLGDEFGAAGTSLLDAFAATSSSWTEQTLALQASIKDTLNQSVCELTDSANSSSASLLTEIGRLLASTEALVEARAESEATWLDSHAQRMTELTDALTGKLEILRTQEAQGQAAALARLAELEAAVATHLTQLGQGLEALTTFESVKRRMELRGTVGGVDVYDDFAHHPTAISTTVAGLRRKVGNARILAVLEPRSNTMKLGVMKAALPGSLADADLVFCYAANLGWNPAEALAPLGGKALIEGDLERLVTRIAETARAGDRILVMSNGGFGGIHEKLLAALAA